MDWVHGAGFGFGVVFVPGEDVVISVQVDIWHNRYKIFAIAFSVGAQVEKIQPVENFLCACFGVIRRKTMQRIL